MYDIITCYDPIPVPDGLKFLDVDWRFEPFKTNCLSKKFENYLIFKNRLYKDSNKLYEEVSYNGFLTFYTHFFDDLNTKQMHVSYMAEFKKGKLNYILLNDFREYDVKKESIKANYFLTIFNLFKTYLKN
jgi:hypothetical protein